jgi:hypothetical protein
MCSKTENGGKEKASATSAETMPKKRKELSTGRWLLGMFIASLFSFSYFFAPIYIITALLCMLLRYPSLEWSLVIGAPLILSVLSKPKKLDGRLLKPMADYFDFEEAFEMSDDDIREMLAKDTNKRFLVAMQPHGVLSYCGMCAISVCGLRARCWSHQNGSCLGPAAYAHFEKYHGDFRAGRCKPIVFAKAL